MGLIAIIKDFFRGESNGAKVNKLTIDGGGGANKTTELFSAVGDDSQPLKTDYVYAGETQETGGFASLGFVDPLNEGITKPGEKRIYSRDSDGVIVASIYLKNDGSIVFANDNGMLELTAAGLFEINGQEFAAHTHDPGTFAAGGDAVTGVSGDVT